MMSAAWEHFDHGADIGVRGIGSSPAEAFEQAAVALSGVITDPAAVRPLTSVAIRCEAPDLTLLFVDWLNALVYEMATRRMLFGRFSVGIAADEAGGVMLEGVAHGEPVDLARHQPAVEVKGATHTELRVEPVADGRWVAGCVVDV